MLKRNLILLGIGLMLWAGISRPLPCHFATAIPYAPVRAANAPTVSEIVPGDHVQLLYHFWLCRDMIAGRTPAFSNIYEFNTGDDASRKQFDPFYIPFSLVYALFSPLFGNAFGWNAACLFSVILGFFGTFLLSRRFTDSDVTATCIAVMMSAFPYRWLTLASGSPTGFAFCLVPWLFYGLDSAVRDKRMSGGFIAGSAIFFAYCSDLHTFFFSALATPVWCVFSWLASEEKIIPDRNRIIRVVRALLPAILLALAAVILSKTASANLGKSTMRDGWPLKEVLRYSPILSGIFRYESLNGTSNQIFFGAGLALLLCASGILFLLDTRISRKEWLRRLVAPAFLAFVAIGVILLSVGANGPFNALPIRIARKLINKYAMIRQPMKIFCLLPSVFAVLLSIFLSAPKAAKRAARMTFAVIALFSLYEMTSRVHIALCELPADIPAYTTAEKAIRDSGVEKPHAVCIPLWPGDSHWSSLYEYGIIGSRMRLLNGYAPAVPDNYYPNYFSKLDALNGGVLTEDELNVLKDAGINAIIFHEQPYPDKVSPFPAAIALRRLRANAALREIVSKGGITVFAFTGLKPDESALDGTPEQLFASSGSYRWPASRLAERKGNTFGEPGLADTYLVRLRAPVPYAPFMRYMMLLSGGGELLGDNGTRVVVPETPTWVHVPFTTQRGECFKVTSGRPFMQCALITAGTTNTLSRGDSFTWRATDFFHTGISESETGSVAFDSKRNGSGITLFGPNLPFEEGEYAVSFSGDFIKGDFTSVQTLGDNVNTLVSSAPEQIASQKVITLRFTYDGLSPLQFAYHYSGTGPSKVTSIRLERK